MTQYRDTGVGTIGGRGQQEPIPETTPQHILELSMTSKHQHVSWFTTPEQAIQERADRLKEARTPYTRDGMTLRYTDPRGNDVTLTYKEPS